VSITIAIDGYAGCGKSSTAKAVAKQLGFIYIDSGAMYRAVTLYLLDNQIPFEEMHEGITQAMQEIQLEFLPAEGFEFPAMHLNGKLVEPAIRSTRVSNAVSPVAIHGPIRESVVDQQRNLGKKGGVVMDGRDIGTVVFPHAELKVFMTAEMEVRAKRRLTEMQEKGIGGSLESVIENLRERDRIDTTRDISPLRQAEDARVLDSTHISFEEQVQQVLDWAQSLMKEKLHSGS